MADMDGAFDDILIAGEAVQAAFQGPVDFFVLKGSNTTAGSSSIPGSPPSDGTGAGFVSHVTSVSGTRLSSSSVSTFAPFARLQSLSHSVSANAVSSPSPASQSIPPTRSFSSLSCWEAVDWPNNETPTHEPRTRPVRTSSNATAAPTPLPKQAAARAPQEPAHQRQSTLKADQIPFNKIVITNFRIFQVEGQARYQLKAQVALDAIASVHHHGHRITISLKFDPCQYVISQEPWGPPTVVEIFSLLRHATTISVSHRFPFFHGPAILEQYYKSKKDKRTKKKGQDTQKERTCRLARLWTTEEILDVQSESGSDDELDGRPEYDGENSLSGAVKKKTTTTRDDPLSNPHPDQSIPHQPSTQADQEARRKKRVLGWHKLFQLQDELHRQGFDRSLWCVADWNANYDLSPTYHTSFICPKNFLTKASSMAIEAKQQDTRQLWRHEQGTQQNQYIPALPRGNNMDNLHPCIRQLAEFRSNARFPVVCWKRPQSGCVLIRSSQPMVGFLGARGHVDESFIRSIMNTAAKQETQRRKRLGISQRMPPLKLCIMDARGYSSAIANGVHGGGHENPDNYLNATIAFMSLANIHVIASSHLSLLKAVQGSADSINWFSALENTAWLTHVSELLKAASGRDGVVGKMTRENCSVLVHCSDGWDRTTQLVSLAQIIMDPYFRTIKGLRALIEKEWLLYGHPFQARNDCQQQRFNKHHPSNINQDNSAPSSTAYDKNSRGWASGGPPVLLSSPNGKSERLSAMPNLSSFSRPNWRKHVSRVNGEDTGWTATPIPNPFSRGSNNDSRQESLQGLPSNRTDIPKADWPYPPSDSSEAFTFSSASRHNAKPTKEAGATVAKDNGPSVVQPKTNPSPVFLLFLTCLHHILQQHPDHFEYNDYLLLLLAKTASGFTPFGDFLFNTERERALAKLRENTVSVWAWIDRHRGLVTHPGYMGGQVVQENEDGNSLSSVLEIQTGGRFISIWSEYYFETLASAASYPLDPSTILSSPIFHPHAPTSRARNCLTTDFWRSTLLATGSDRGFPMAGHYQTSSKPLKSNKRAISTTVGGMAHGTPHSRPSKKHHDAQHSSTQDTQDTQTIEQYLDLVHWRHIREQYEDEHLLLMHFLRRKRKSRVEQVFVKWAAWAKAQQEVRTAREAGWIVEDGEDHVDGDGRRSGGHNDGRDFSSDADGSDDEQTIYGRTAQKQDKTLRRSFMSRIPFTVGSLGRESSKGSSDNSLSRSAPHKSRTRIHTSPPELVVHAGRRGLTYEMEQILDTSQEAFFGDHPLILDDDSSEETQQEEVEMELSLPHQESALQNGIQRAESIYSDDGFDDLGFPVVSLQTSRQRRL